jgi:hypothetical protein
MTLLTFIFLAANAAALLVLPRNIALLPLLLGCCYMTVTQRIDIGPITLTVIRILVAVGFLRVILRGEGIVGGFGGMDKLVIAWMACLVASSALHPGERGPWVFNFGQAFNIGGIYFLSRVFCANHDELVGIFKLTAWLLAPIALEMVSEHITGRNLFSIFGAVILEREGKFRAVGPFAHAILAGSVGAATFPLMLSLWKEHRFTSMVGMLSCLLMVGASNSSGPLMSLILATGALILWLRSEWTTYARWGCLAGYLLLELVMNRPAYYIIAAIDLTGSSTGWHRAQLIESAIANFDEWWLAGTNFTRHWMPTGVTWSQDHCDITNYYLQMGVWGGIVVMILFIAMIVTGFRYVGAVLASLPPTAGRDKFITWCIGSALFAHSATSISVSYFDQSYIFFFLCLAAITSLKFHSMQEDDETADIRSADDGQEEPAADREATRSRFIHPMNQRPTALPS